MFYRCIFLFLFFLFGINSSALASGKKGVAVADLHAPERVAALNVAWYYTWKPQPIEGAPPEKFVPMVWGGGRLLNDQIAALRAKGKVPVLLAINEPDQVKQSNMSVEEVIRIWPELTSLADQISAPAPAGALGPWIDKFYRTAKARGLKFDFMAVHLYTPPDAKKFLKKIDAVHEKYHMPIWITEFSVADWKAKDKPGSNRYSEDEVLAFMKAVLPELEKRQYVVRYAWFEAGKKAMTFEQLRTSKLFKKDGSLTELGQFYAEFQ